MKRARNLVLAGIVAVAVASRILATAAQSARPWLGVSFVETDVGVLVTELSPGGPAAKSELKPGDVIVGVNDKLARTAQQLHDEIYPRGVDHVVTLNVYRGPENIKVKLKI